MVDLTGKRYAHLTVLERFGTTNYREATWLCRCDCGKETVVISSNLRRGNTRSCGHLHRRENNDG